VNETKFNSIQRLVLPLFLPWQIRQPQADFESAAMLDKDAASLKTSLFANNLNHCESGSEGFAARRCTKSPARFSFRLVELW
jgi:hypothetical protein